MQDVESDSAYWSAPVEALMVRLESAPGGLAAIEAAQRLRRVGANTVEDRDQQTALRLMLRQFESPLVLILIFGAGISLWVRDWIDAVIILTIILGSAALGFVQEFRASVAVTALRRRLALIVEALRDGRITTIPASEVVPGDVIRLAAGSLVPADGVVLEAVDFLVTEASLTGESFPVEKRASIVPTDTPLAGRLNSVFMGTSVRSGSATVLIVKTGRGTEFGAIAERLKARQPETEFARGVRQFGYLLVRMMIIMVVFVLMVNQALGRPVIESLLYAVALAVGISPELLPAIVSVTLSHGARALAAQGVIVRRLEAIENLGSMDVLCTDKTGTLTEGVITLVAAVDTSGSDSAFVRQLAWLNASFETGIPNPLDAAIVANGVSGGLSTTACVKIDEIPYDFIRKRMTIVVSRHDDASDRHRMITKGAYTQVLDICSRVLVDGSEQPLDDAQRARTADYFRRSGEEGYRVLAVATRLLQARESYTHHDETDLCLVGFLLFSDPPKADAGRVIGNLARLGIRTKVISGDNRFVTAHLAASIGLDPAALLTGEQVARLSDEALWHLAERTDLFVEVDPQQKERIVRALQRTGHAVGYLGDGINDAAALNAADVGISVEGAADVARDSADVVLLRSDLDVLRSGVEDGRRTFANTLKYISITTSANFGNMVSMAFATPFLPFLPLAAKQILLNNFLSDLPSMAISTDRVDRDHITHVQRWNVGEVRRFMIVFGLISSSFDLLTFLVLLNFFHTDEPTFQTAWFVVSLLTELAVLLVLRTALPAWRSGPGPLLLWGTVVFGALAVALPYLQPLASVFSFVPLSAQLLATLLLIVTGYIVCTEIGKAHFFRRYKSGKLNSSSPTLRRS
ncbi:MAG: magnesium-translocating P-type ATPase [Aromatoleum sp.]|jgi:Mg2+-importing ATPase|uniref:magnesium-translocating P-type ATPase n=1 Tax=Aromatoleum sp. TaxID=2307007 RepID=UPI002894F714|nr:magnesium-translocating P-type ATPase [Aromatoleum sp.]MDT3671320.1 magnesium-translocating P-type ATPase [Aromatoleum sp.]